MKLVFIHSNIYCQSTTARLNAENLKINKIVSYPQEVYCLVGELDKGKHLPRDQMGKTQSKQTECHVQRYGWSKVTYIKISGHEAIDYARKAAKDKMTKYFLYSATKYEFYPMNFRSEVSNFLTRGGTSADLCFRKKNSVSR